MESASIGTSEALGDGAAAPHSPDIATGASTDAKRAIKRPFLIVGLVILTALAALVVYLMRTRGQESTDDAQVEGDVVTISVRVPGLVIAVPAEDNHRVKKGDRIAQIDDTDYAGRLKQAEAELAQARAQAAQAEAQEQIVGASAKGGIAAGQALVAGSSYAVRGAHANVASARAAVDLAEGDERIAELDLARCKALREANAVPQSKLDEVQAAADHSRATVAQARAALNASEEEQHAADARVSEAQGRLTQSAPIETQLNAARANTELQRGRVMGAEAAVALAQSQLDATHVVAPADGLLTNLSLHPGVLAAVGTPVALLVPPEVYVVANFKETQVGALRPGQPVAVSVDAFAPRVFEGNVDTIAGGTQGRFSLLPSDNAGENFVKVVQRVPVKIRLAATDIVLLPGLSAGVTVNVR
ncbi:MAG TPA: HlyD family secretion protein [Polyangiaceae bacterium]|jgi:membrane fusion protein (multidrug efflux system)|nr:HlyD family secretion protein [Polyangiaceae bacterium]